MQLLVVNLQFANIIMNIVLFLVKIMCDFDLVDID